MFKNKKKRLRPRLSSPKKSALQARHSQERALERYDLTLSKNQLKEIVEKIQCGDGKFLEKQSNKISVWLVVYKEKEIVVVYDRKRKHITTFLPLEMWTKGIIVVDSKPTEKVIIKSEGGV